MTNRIVITIHGNEDVISIDGMKRISDTWMGGSCSSSKIEDAPLKVQELYAALSCISGVTEVSFNKYETRVERAAAFEWKEIAPNACKLIAEFCDYDGYEVSVRDQRPTSRYDNDGYPIGRSLDLEPVDLGLHLGPSSSQVSVAA